MDYIVDIQSFTYGVDYKLLPKEVAVLSTTKDYVRHWIISPPCPFSELRAVSRQGNTWQTNNYHGLEWFEDGITLDQLEVNLQRIARHASHVITRGRERTIYLQEIMGRNIINLDDIADLKAFRDIPPSETYCMIHGVERAQVFKCALNNVYTYKRLLRTIEDFRLDRTVKCLASKPPVPSRKNRRPASAIFFDTSTPKPDEAKDQDQPIYDQVYESTLTEDNKNQNG